ncbi:MAG: ferredoxin--NADP reductase [Pseudomonadota bacterium]
MAAIAPFKVTAVKHWNERLFSFKTERAPEFRFENGHFTMVGLRVDGKPLLRAYSIASANYEEELEFFSIIVDDGPLTSRLQHIKIGDEVLLGRKPVGTLLLADLHAGRNLYFFATGTGLAPFMSLVRDPECYSRYEKVVLIHCTRRKSDLAYYDFLTKELPEHPLVGEQVSQQFVYYPTTTREETQYTGRITDLLNSGKLESDLKELGVEPLDPAVDRAMICGSMVMLKDISAILDARGFKMSPNQGVAGDYVIERAFAG